MARRILLLLFRLLLVAAAYVAAFAVFWQFPMPDRLFAIIPGTLLGMLLFLIKWDQIKAVLFVGGTTIIGVLTSFVLLAPGSNGYGRVQREITAAVAGAVIGGILGLAYSSFRRRQSAASARNERKSTEMIEEL